MVNDVMACFPFLSLSNFLGSCIQKQCGVKYEDMGVMSAYRAQVKLLAMKIPTQVEVNTIDQYQGRDKDLVIISTAKQSGRNNGDIWCDHRRLTVAVTRAKKKLIMLGNAKHLQDVPPFAKLFKSLDEVHVIHLESSQLGDLPSI
ncbi:unnamed protein product [Darwinula stevensoni]|uniref:DNA2/NAM7 helicase-like C-terminal domain-containing protein n=1 Tax=Darwinula stevensoni TaxID=69355 RepID=A0A7R8X1V4_9CRUS|nr:unnamed protein product [Darwinula stevensoni]CAG0883230.1 unnamed protein product [Darwinula stevensoni]